MPTPPTPAITVTSYFALMLLNIQARITALCPEIKWIDQDLGQLEEDTERPRVQWPCLLIDFPEASYDEMQNQRQWASATIQFRLGFNPFTSSAMVTPLPSLQLALSFYELEQKVFIALQAWNGEGLCQPLTRTKGRTENGRADMFRVRVMTFTTTFQDSSAVPTKNTAARPQLAIADTNTVTSN